MIASVRSLLVSIVDYAGLFPPAELNMHTAVENYATYRTGEYAWMLGRFIVPAARLTEFDSAVRQIIESTGVGSGQAFQPAWHLSVLTGTDPGADVKKVIEFQRQLSGATSTTARHASGAGQVVVDAIEFKANDARAIQQIMADMPPGTPAYAEIPVSSDLTVFTAARSAGARVKVRTGGVVPEAFPSSAELAGFLSRCTAIGIAFKATAGLHHPIRSVHRLTYADDSPRAMMHGFLNVFLAAGGLSAGLSIQQAQDLLEETSPEAFHFDDQGVNWANQRWTCEQLNAARNQLAIAFGSCSFLEPVEDLRALRLL